MGATAEARGATSHSSILLGTDLISDSHHTINIGSNNDGGNYSMALGDANTISGNGNLWAGAIGHANTVNNQGGYALGQDNIVDGSGAIAVGVGNKVSGNNSMTLGFAMQVDGEQAFGLGSSGRAWRRGSTAFGYNVDVSGNYAAAFGYETSAPWIRSFVIGQWNDVSGANSGSGVLLPVNQNNPVFVIGAGSSQTDRKNIFTVKWSGETDISGTLDVSANGPGGSATRFLVDVSNSEIIADTSGGFFGLYEDYGDYKIKLSIPEKEVQMRIIRISVGLQSTICSS